MAPARAGVHGATGARIAATLREAILDGAYAPGERIRQDELAERHGASRLPVREALRMLEAEGLVTLVANTGAWVSTLSSGECQELYLVRERLEPLLLRMNVPLLTDDEIARLQVLADRMERSADVEDFLLMDREFHLSGVDHADTTVLTDLVKSLWNRTQHYRRAATRLFWSEGDRSVHHDHQLLVGALRRRDADDAETLLAQHIRRSRLELSRHPEVFDLPGV
ncbi:MULTISPECIES: GntR family transcriptional regulator [Microbacterium]|uniref:GntR family transcriptional regulator n=1 Tax=Microbacterium wangchenii TaxID=2541726 RepID=A0ABX5SXV9_9MICO|nr:MULTISPECIES: GntR family transcriptional regulator [Microbacterium]MCK6067100.1 GntR family transcriptional regulator [Microbacterium sp. EYE_512]QBR89938.1 GntR family transcriptional regulator [Microbacterium wangchenii]TXK16466.1 GntR family transcriptional regulator [Microbacterium wangchenii]